MEKKKYAEIVKAVSVCVGPDCGPQCPYHGKSVGTKTCRALLLENTVQALVFEEERAEKADERIISLNADIDDLEAANNTIRAERDGMRIELAKMAEERATLLNEIHTMRQGKTDRPSVFEGLPKEITHMIGQAKYQEGRADALAEIVARCSFGGGCRHE